MRLNPQLNHDAASDTKVTSATALFGDFGHDAMPRIARAIGGDVASTWPVMMISDICSVKGIRSQKPRPQASTICAGVEEVATAAARMTMTVAASAKMNASGTHRSVQSVRISAARATAPGRSSLMRVAIITPGTPGNDWTAARLVTRRLLEGVRKLEHAEIVAMAADNLNADRQAIAREAGRH